MYYSYDLETYKNLFTATFVNINDDKDIHQFILYEDKINQLDKLVEFISNKKLIGYNNSKFDDIILYYIHQSEGKCSVSDIYSLAQRTIEASNSNSIYNDKYLSNIIKYGKQNKIFLSLDLMKVLAFDKLMISLKKVAVNLQHELIQDLPLHHTEDVKEEDIQLVLDYNLNDVIITNKLYKKIEEDINMRVQLEKIYNVPLINASNSRIGDVLMNKLYSDATGLHYNDFKDIRTDTTTVNIKDCILPVISFKSKQLNKLLDDLKAMNINISKKVLDIKVAYGKKYYQLGIGGLHSIDEPGVFESNEEYNIIDVDAESEYPNLIINYKLKPKHLDDKFIDVLDNIIKQRVEAKRNKNEAKSYGLKIAANSCFGKFGSDSSWLGDKEAMVKVTINGQLMLLMLIESFEDNGIEVISANTDGITCKVYNKQLDLYKKLVKNWQIITKFNVEYTYYKKYIRRDVNNYIVILDSGKTKSKGIFAPTELHKGYDKPIVQKALYEYYVNNEPIEKTIYESDNIYDFCMSQKIGGQFKPQYHYIDGYNQVTENLQKTNRYYVSKNGGYITKLKENGSVTRLVGGNKLTLFNKYFKADKFEDYKINYNYYISETNKIVSVVNSHNQLQLF